MDTPKYEGLGLVEYGNEADLVAAAISYAQAAMPEWDPRAGNTEVVLIESLAVMLGPELLSLRLVANEVVEQFVGLFGVKRDLGRPVAGRVRITVTNSRPLQVIPAGSRFRLPLPDTGQSVDFLTSSETQIITSETLSGEVRVVATQLGETGNRTPSGTTLESVDPLSFIESVVVSSRFSEGAGEEADADFQGRASATFARLTSTLVGAETFQYAALSRPNVRRAKVRDNLDPAAPNETTYGHVTIAAANNDGEPLSSEEKDQLHAFITEQSLASLTIHVIDPTYTTVDFAATVRALPGYTADVVKTNVESVLREWLDPSMWEWGATISEYEAVNRLYAAEGVASVVQAPESKALAGIAPLPRLGSVQITVAP